MDYEELLEKYRLLVNENNQLIEENLREYELEAAIIETKKDIEEGRFFEGTIEEHIKRVVDV